MKGLKKLSLLIAASMMSALITVPASAAETRIIVSDDFERYDSKEELYRSYSCGSERFDLNAADIAEEAGHGKVLKITKPEATVPQIMKYLDDVCSDGIVEFDYSIKPSGANTTLFTAIDSQGESVQLTMFEKNDSSGAFMAFTNNRGLWVGSVKPDIWYDVHAEVNFITKKITVNTSSADAASGISNTKLTFDNKLADVARVRLQVWGSGAGQSSYYDNIKIKSISNRKDSYAASKLLFEDFEDNKVDGFKEVGGGGAKITDIGGERGKVWEFPAKCGGPRQYMKFAEKTTGKYGMKFSVKPDSAGNLIFGVDNTGNNATSAKGIFSSSGTIQNGGSKNVSTFKNDVWYDVYLVIDLDNKTAKTMIFGEDGTCTTMSDSYSASLYGFYLQKWGGEGKGTHYVDDIEIVENPPEFPKIVLNSPVTDNFDSGITGWNFGGSYSSCATTEDSYSGNGKALALTRNTANNNELMFKTLGDAMTMGKMNISFDICPGSGIYTGVRISNTPGSKVLSILGFDGNTVQAGSNNIGSFTAGDWYHCDAVFDIDKKLLSGKLSNVTGEYSEILFDNIDMSYLDDAKAICFQIWGGTVATSYFDNLSVSFEFDDGVLSLSADDVSIYNKGILQDKNGADIGSDKIVIEMNKIMNPVAAVNMVKLVDNKTGKEVKFNGMTDGTKYIMNLIDELSFDTGYTLTVSKNIGSAMNTTLGTDFSYSFNTTSKNISLKPSNNKFVDLKFNNLEENKEMTLIYGYYKDGVLTGVDTRDIVIPADECGEFVDTGSFEYSEDVDAVKVMLWDNLGNIKPMTEYVARDAEEKILSCDENGEFTVLVVGDPQAYALDVTTNKTISNWQTAREELEKLVEKVEPDLVIINGDLFGCTGWSSFEKMGNFVSVLEENNIAWATTNGNHDPYNKYEYEIYKNFANNINETVSKDDPNYDSDRPVNYALPIYANDGETPIFAVWGMDSGPELSSLSEKQVAWYKAKSDELKEMNDGEAVTGLLCMHIPLPQMNELKVNEGGKFGTLYGIIDPGSQTNKDVNGMFDALKEKGDIKAIINSHCHDTNLIGSYYDGDYTVLMGFSGKISNSDSHSTAVRGGRVIKINQNDPDSFKTSWVPVLDGAAQPEIYFDGIAAIN